MQTESKDILLILVFSSLSMFSLAAFFVYTIYRYQKRIQQKQKELFAAVIQAQEHEKERIANDLHDQVGPLLSNIKFNIGLFEDISQLEQFKKDNSKLIDIAIDNIRTASYDLLPKVLYEFGLVDALEDSCDLVSRGTNMQVQFNYQDVSNKSQVLSKQFELTIYRVVMEILNNSVKYSKATLLDVKILKGVEFYEVHVTDNGIGFNMQDGIPQKKSGMGIKNIYSRVEAFEGSCELTSNHAGTKYHLLFKVKNLV
jgi:signal transduction histidine kinase